MNRRQRREGMKWFWICCCSGEHQPPLPELRARCLKLFCRVFLSQNLVGDQEHLTIQVSELEEEVSTLRKINKNLFDFSARIITKPAK